MMLPNARTLKTAAIAGAAALATALTLAAPAQAFGDKDRAFAQGAAAAIIIDRLMDQGRAPRSEYRYAPAPQPQYYVPQRQYRYYEEQPAYRPRQIYVEPRYTIYDTPAAAAFSDYTPATRRAIQAELADYGYYNGRLDGQWGQGTWRAVQAYARDEGRSGLLDSRNGAVRLFNGLLR